MQMVAVTRDAQKIVGRFCAMPRLLSLRRMPKPRPDASPRVDTQSRADQKSAPRNSMLNDDHRFSGFAMRTKED